MKFKIILISAIALILILATGGIIYYNKTKNADSSVEVAKEEQITDENEITEDNINELENVAEITEETENVENNTEQVEQTETVTEQQTQETATVKSSTNSNSKSQSTQSSSVIKTEEKTETQQTEQVAETPKQETQTSTQTTKTYTENDLEYWCVSGGSHHVAGDGANEHGYYQTWDQAQKALDEYVKGWDSIQYKISQCSCGLYYFWVVEN